jgi:hypothetical protein
MQIRCREEVTGCNASRGVCESNLIERQIRNRPARSPANSSESNWQVRKRRSTDAGDNLPKRHRRLDCGGWESPSGLKLGYPESAACGSRLRRAYRPDRSCGRVAEGGGLLNRYRVVKPYRGFESLRLRHRHYSVLSVIRITCNSRSSRRGASRCIAMPLLEAWMGEQMSCSNSPIERSTRFYRNDSR